MRIDHKTEERIDQICLKFEDDMRTGRSFSIEENLALVTSEARVRLLRELLLLELDYSLEPPDFELLVSRFPEFESTIRECLQVSRTLTPQRLQAGDRVGRYLVQELLGEGAFGSVYTAWDEKLQRCVALKSPRLLGEATSLNAERFQLEAIALAKLRHPNIVAIHDVLSDQNGWPLLVLEHLVARPLDVTASQAEVVRVLIDVARAMDYVHQQGIVHRDLKPPNILIEGEGRAVVADFGLSMHADARHKQCGESAGTIKYMSPELVRGESHWADGRADIWSLGVMLYEALAGAVPFGGDDYESVAHAILHSPAKPPRQTNPSCPVELEEICLQCLRKAPEDRFATARDLANALRRYQTAPQRRGLLRQRMPIALAVGCLCLMIAAAMVPFFRGGAAELDQPPAVQLEQSPVAEQSSSRAERIAALIQFYVVRDHPDGLSRLRLETATPLQSGDHPEIWVQTQRPCRFWVVWIDAQGKVLPVYPWRETNWELLPDSHEMVTELELAPNWKLGDMRSGSETLLVLGSTADTDVDVDIRALLGDWQPQSKQLVEALYYDFGRPIESTVRSEVTYDRDFELPLFENQRMFREPRFQRFAVCRSICIPVMGSGP